MGKIANLQEVPVEKLKPYDRNAKKHSKEQVAKLVKSIESFGFLSPCLIDADYNIIAGHGRVMAAKALKMETVPAVFIEDLTEEQRRAYIIADNRLTELGEWDDEILQAELEALKETGFDIELTGFELNLDPDDVPEITDEEVINPTEILPDSKCYIFAVSVFGTNSEKILMIKLDPETQQNVLEAISAREPTEIVDKIKGCLNDL